MVNHPQQDVLAASVTTQQSRTIAATSSAAAQSIIPQLFPDREESDLRVSAAATTPEPNFSQLLIGTPTPSPTPAINRTPVVTGTPVATNTPLTAVVSPTATPAVSATPTATPTKAPNAAPDCDRSQSQIYCVYTVNAGDTLSGIASKFGLTGNEDVAPWELVVNSNKPDIVDEDDILSIGQKLRIPTAGVAVPPAASASAPATATPRPGSTPAPATTSTSTARAGGVIHTVLTAQTMIEIADQYGVTTADIMATNNLSNPDRLSIGQELIIVNPKRFTPTASPAPTPPPAAAAAPSSGGSSSSASQASVTGPRSRSGYIWPTSGPISSYFGPNHPRGIDIDLFNNPNAPIGAAAAGTVSFAGGNSCCSYGLYVIVDHGGGISTLYAHMSKLSVTTGQRVSQGQILGNGGRTGYATGNHLHFEVQQNGSSVNPMGYLP